MPIVALLEQTGRAIGWQVSAPTLIKVGNMTRLKHWKLTIFRKHFLSVLKTYKVEIPIHTKA